jgi:hypothetical protein
MKAQLPLTVLVVREVQQDVEMRPERIQATA